MTINIDVDRDKIFNSKEWLLKRKASFEDIKDIKWFECTLCKGKGCPKCSYKGMYTNPETLRETKKEYAERLLSKEEIYEKWHKWKNS